MTLNELYEVAYDVWMHIRDANDTVLCTYCKDVEAYEQKLKQILESYGNSTVTFLSSYSENKEDFLFIGLDR